MTSLVEHISFSSLKDWKTCPYYFKLTRIDKVGERIGNIYTEFGQAIHQTLEFALIGKIEESDVVSHFRRAFEMFIGGLPQEVQPTEQNYKEFLTQGEKIIPLVIPALREKFGEFEIVDTEHDLYENISPDQQIKFKGFIDLVIKTKDGMYYVIDWKTTSWGWDIKKKSDPMVTYQLTYYKNFFAQKKGIDPKNIETYFALIKRTAKKDNVEFFRVTSGPRKTKNALKLLDDCLYNVNNQKWVKNRLSCQRCDFHKTEYCP